MEKTKFYQVPFANYGGSADVHVTALAEKGIVLVSVVTTGPLTGPTLHMKAEDAAALADVLIAATGWLVASRTVTAADLGLEAA